MNEDNPTGGELGWLRFAWSIIRLAPKWLSWPKATIENIDYRFHGNRLSLRLHIHLERVGIRRRIKSIEVSQRVQGLPIFNYSLRPEIGENEEDRCLTIRHVLDHLKPRLAEYWTAHCPPVGKELTGSSICDIPFEVDPFIEKIDEERTSEKRQYKLLNTQPFPLTRARIHIPIIKPVKELRVSKGSPPVPGSPEAELERLLFTKFTLQQMGNLYPKGLSARGDDLKDQVSAESFESSKAGLFITLDFEPNEDIQIEEYFL